MVEALKRRPPLVVVVGPSCSGKSTISRALQRAGYSAFELSAPLSRLVPRGLALDERLRTLTALYQRTQGRVLIEDLLPTLQVAARSTPVAVIGARQLPEIDVLSAEMSRPVVIAVYADDATRYQRSQARQRPDGPHTFEQFIHLTYWEYSIGLAAIMRDATSTIHNTSTEQHFELLAEQLVREQLPSLGEPSPMR
jgi:dephospho-CoA kinase